MSSGSICFCLQDTKNFKNNYHAWQIWGYYFYLSIFYSPCRYLYLLVRLSFSISLSLSLCHLLFISQCGINVYDDGRVLSLVANAGSHGTHVAAIVGAHFPECPDKNGIAPGVQMISGMCGSEREIL